MLQDLHHVIILIHEEKFNVQNFVLVFEITLNLVSIIES